MNSSTLSLKRSYYFGVALWSRWLPVAATGIFLALLTVSLFAPSSELGLGGFFSTTELVALFLVGPLFLTRFGNVLAAASVVYCMERLLIGHPNLAPTMSLYLITASATVVAVLADKMPWLAANGGSRLAEKTREILLFTITVGCLAVTCAGIVKVNGFARWFAQTFDVAIPPSFMLLGLVALFLGWLSVGLGFTRNVAMPLLGLPSLFVVSYITNWQTFLLVVPFSICMALSLATGDRRSQSNRRTTGFATTVVLPRAH